MQRYGFSSPVVICSSLYTFPKYVIIIIIISTIIISSGSTITILCFFTSFKCRIGFLVGSLQLHEICFVQWKNRSGYMDFWIDKSLYLFNYFDKDQVNALILLSEFLFMQSSSLPAIFAFLLTKEKIISSAYYSQRTPFFFLYSSWGGRGVICDFGWILKEKWKN